MVVANQEALDKRAEVTIGILLRTGVLLAAAVVLAGGVFYLLRSPAPRPAYAVFRGEPAHLRNITGILRAARALDAGAIIQFGLLLLIGTPVARVAFSVWAFMRERDWMYVTVTLGVLALLLYSLFASHF
jgi:uncharacterized membrane protein